MISRNYNNGILFVCLFYSNVMRHHQVQHFLFISKKQIFSIEEPSKFLN